MLLVIFRIEFFGLRINRWNKYTKNKTYKMRILLTTTIVILLFFYESINAQVTTKVTNTSQPQKVKKVYIPKSVKNFTGGGRIDQAMVPKGTKDNPTVIRLWKGEFTIYFLEGYVNIIMESGAEIAHFYTSSRKLNASLYMKNKSKINVFYNSTNEALDKIYTEKNTVIVILATQIKKGLPIPAEFQGRINRCEKITTHGEGDLKEFYKTYTASANYLPKYKIGTFAGLDYERSKGKDIYLIFNYNSEDEKLYLSLSDKYTAVKNRGYKTGMVEWMYIDNQSYRMGPRSVSIPINSNTKDFMKIGKISYAILERKKVQDRQYFNPGLVVDVRPLKKDVARRKRIKAIEAEKKRRMAAKQAKIDAYNANPKNWRRGDRVCLRVIGSVFGFGVVNQRQPIRAVIEFFNEDRSRVKVKILESQYNGSIDGEEIYKGNFIWITPQATYRGNTKWMLCK